MQITGQHRNRSSIFLFSPLYRPRRVGPPISPIKTVRTNPSVMITASPGLIPVNWPLDKTTDSGNALDQILTMSQIKLLLIDVKKGLRPITHSKGALPKLLKIVFRPMAPVVTCLSNFKRTHVLYCQPIQGMEKESPFNPLRSLSARWQTKERRIILVLHLLKSVFERAIGYDGSR